MTAELKENEYRCCVCGEVYEKGWTDEEAIEEQKRNLGAEPREDDEIMCDDCYKKFMQETFN